MKSFFSLFSDSTRELKKVSTLTVTGMLMALSIVLRSMYIPITQDLRITFSFLGVMAVAMLYGPTVCVISNIGIDIIGYLLDGCKMREYNFALLAVKIIIAIIYGIILYRKTYGKKNLPDKLASKLPDIVSDNLDLVLRAAAARIIVVFLGNIVLNSSVLYVCYTNPDFPFMSGSEWTAFWIWFSPRLIKNLVLLPFELILTSLLLPAIRQAYKQVFKTSAA